MQFRTPSRKLWPNQILVRHPHCNYNVKLEVADQKYPHGKDRGGICPCRQCWRQCKTFASGVYFSIFTHFLCFFLLKLLKLGEIDGVKYLAWKSGGVKFWTNSMSGEGKVIKQKQKQFWNQWTKKHNLGACNIGHFKLCGIRIAQMYGIIWCNNIF